MIPTNLIAEDMQRLLIGCRTRGNQLLAERLKMSLKASEGMVKSCESATQGVTNIASGRSVSVWSRAGHITTYNILLYRRVQSRHPGVAIWYSWRKRG